MKHDEEKRLKELTSYQILDTDLHEELQGLTEIASTICDTPISMINLLDSDFQITKSSKGLDIHKVAAEAGFCGYTISDKNLMIVEDAQQDRRFKDSPYVTSSPNIRFYAAMPLESPNGYNLGTICVLDSKPRTLNETQKNTLRVLAKEVIARLELYKKNKQLQKSDRFLGNSSDIQAIIDPDTFEILDISNETLNIFERDPKDFVGQIFGNRLANSQIKKQILDFLSSKQDETQTFICPVTKRDDEILYLEHTFSLYGDKWYMTARDITNREKNLDNLKKARIKKEAILNSASDCIITTDHNNNIIQFNSAAESTFGYKRDEILGQSVHKLLPTRNRKDYQQNIERFLELGNSGMLDHLLEMPAIDKNGNEFPVELQVNYIENSDPAKFIWILRDISERRETQKRLQKTLTNLNIGQDLADLGSWTWRKNEDSVQWSEKVYDILDIRNITQKPSIDLFLDKIHPQDREKAEQQFNSIAEGEKLDNIEHRIITSNGKVKWVRHSAITTYDSDSNPIEINGAIQNITAQKEAQIQLEKEKELSDKIINSLPIAFFMFDQQNNAIRWNSKVRNTTGYNEQRIAYMGLHDFLAEKNQQQIEQEFTNVINNGESTFEANFRDSEANSTPYIFRITPFQSKKNDYFLCTGLDITQIKKYEKQLKNSLKDKEVLLAEIHHRVKNNLAVISGLLQLESFNAADTKTENILQNSQLRIQSMATIHEMLYNSQSFNNLDFESFVPAIVQSIQNVYQGPQTIDFEFDIGDVSLNVNQAIPCGLIINELVTNAYKHAFDDGDTGIIQIHLNERDNIFALQIADNGRGLPKDFSLEDTSSIGFTLINTLIEQLDGDFNIDSSDGTAISISFKKEHTRGSSSSLQFSPQPVH